MIKKKKIFHEQLSVFVLRCSFTKFQRFKTTQKDDTEGGKQLFLKYRHQRPTCCPALCPGYMQHLFPPNSVTVVYRPTQTCCVRKKKRNFIWQVDHCALYGRKQSVFCLGRFLLLHQTPFSCLQPWGGKDGWISDTCEMLNWSHQLGLSQQLKVTDPKTLCAVVSFFEMPYGTKILFFSHWFMRVWRLSQCRAVLKDSSLVWLKTWNTLKYLFCKVVQVNSTVSQLCSAI